MTYRIQLYLISLVESAEIKAQVSLKASSLACSFLMMMFSPARLLGIEFSAILATRLGLVWMIFHPLPASSESRSSVLMWTVPHPPF